VAISLKITEMSHFNENHVISTQNRLYKEIYTTEGAKTKTFNVEQVAHKAILEQFGKSSLSNGIGEE
jgi:hypothetical protein